VRVRGLLAAACAAALSIGAQASAQSSSLTEDAAAFGARESASGVDISPDGKNVVYIAPAPKAGSVAFAANLETGNVKAVLSSGSGPEKLSWCSFITNDRLICRYRAILNDTGKLVGFSRLIAVDRDGSHLKQLGQAESFYDAGLRQYDGEIIDWMPGQDGSVLMARQYVPEINRTGSRLARSKAGYGVDRVNTLSLKSNAVESPKPDVSDYVTDGRGNVRLMAMSEDSGEMLTGRVRYFYRAQGSRDWKPLTQFAEPDEFVPLAIDATIDSLFALKPLNGRQALYRIKMTDPVSTELVASHPRVDIEDVTRAANGGRVTGYTFVEDQRETTYFDPEYKALMAMLGKAIPNLPLIHFAGASQDGSKVLILASADNDPGRYFVFDKTAKRLNEVMLARPELEKRKLAAVKPVTVTSADGTPVPAYLTLPVGKEGKNLPAVVLPHGGPSSRDEWGFDWLAQFLAARGYAVLQPNYRGSAGFGDAWLMENGFKSWRTSIGDITASAKWLSSQGIADPSRMAIVGWSYGGYAALQSAAVEPGLFKAVAAIAPVTDLAMLKREAEGYTNRDIVADFIGSGPHIEEGSPLRHASKIKAPVLLVHGDMDQNVGVDESAKMESALRSAGTQVQFLRYKDLDHQLDDSAARREMLTSIGTLLEKAIGR
jgi:dipeptidyl aminopeptidase/acylaminoacyl peptidase